jgi:TRAP-type C4-dicarboxylate transport system permease large subunit
MGEIVGGVTGGVAVAATDSSMLLVAYAVYLVLSLLITVWVARTLHANGRLFLVDAFHGQEALADSVNKLLVVGFYLINLGWIVNSLRIREVLTTAPHAVESLADKIGTVLLVLGVMHFFNLFLFNRFRRRALDELPSAEPPIRPTGLLPRV